MICLALDLVHMGVWDSFGANMGHICNRYPRVSVSEQVGPRVKAKLDPHAGVMSSTGVCKDRGENVTWKAWWALLKQRGRGWEPPIPHRAKAALNSAEPPVHRLPSLH